MGRLKDTLDKSKARKYSGGSFGKEMIYISGLIIYQLGSEIHVAKNRQGDNGFIELPDMIKIIVNEYIKDRCNCGPTFSKMFNAVIGLEIENAVREIFIKHKLSN